MATCYGQDGNVDPDFYPCNQTAILDQKHTSCCKKGENCFSNGLCRHASEGTTTNYYWLEGCTDPTFSDPACSIRDSCRDWGNLYWKCFSSKAWCCNNGAAAPIKERSGHINTTCCNLTEFMFNAPDPVVYTQATPMRLPISTLVSSSETAIDPASSSSATSLATTTQLETSIPALTAPTTDVSSTQNTTASSSGSSNSTNIGIGVGVGLGVGAIALSAIFYVLLQRKRRQNELIGNEIVELPSPNARFELHSHEVASEVMSEKTRYEMRA